MKNKDIHNHLLEKEIRNFLSQEMKDAERNGGFYDEDGCKKLEEDIKRLQDVIVQSKIRIATRQLITQKGWEVWDISEDIPYDTETYFPFLGTEEEHNSLIEKIHKGKEEKEK